MGSCQQVVMINLRTIKSHEKKTFRTVPFTFVLYSKIRAVVFSKQFWVVDAPFERSSPSRLQSVHNIYPSVLRLQAVMSLYKIRRGYLFVLICGRFRKHRGPPSLAAFTE